MCSFLWVVAACSPKQETDLSRCDRLVVRGPIALEVFRAPLLESGEEVLKLTADPINLDLADPDTGEVRLSSDVAASGRLTCNPRGIALYGGAEMVVAELRGPEVEVRVSGDSRLVVEAIEADAGLLMLSGQSQARLLGEVSELTIDMSGKAQADLGELRVQTARLRGRGESALNLWVTAHLYSDVTDGVALNVSGDPERSTLEP